MRVKILYSLSVLLLLSSACSLQSNTGASLATDTPDLQAIVDAGVAATQQVENQLQATIEAAVTATVGAAPVEAPTASEDTLVSEIDAAVEDAVTATEVIATTTIEISTDGVVTAEEYAALEQLLMEAAVLVDYANYWIETYSDVYGELAADTLQQLDDIEAILMETEDSLNEIIALLETGTELAGEALETLNGLVANALRSALADQSISAAELETIAQIGANATAGLQAYGGSALSGLSANINQFTQMLAQGQFGQVSGGLGNLEAAIPNLSRP